MHTKLHEDWCRRSNNIKVLSQKSEMLQCCYYQWEEFFMYTVEMPSCDTIFLPNFINIGAGFQVILWFRFSNLNNCNIDITDGKEL
jgi:hypothetical protein